MPFINFSVFLICFLGNHQFSNALSLDFETDRDIQEAVIAVVNLINEKCPIVFLYDDQLPDLSVSYILMENIGRMFILVNMSPDNQNTLIKLYGTREASEIIANLLHSLYRQGGCYIFLTWVRDPRILYPEPSLKYHPGYRRTDTVLLVSHHITKRHRSLTNLRFWNHIPNIVGFKRGKDETQHLAVNLYTVLPYYRDGRRKPQELDVWLVSKKQFMHNRTLFFEKFSNFHNASLVLGIIWKEPFFIWGDQENPYLDGLDWRLFQLCQKYLNFSFSFAHMNSTGREVEKGVWSGMLGLLSEGLVSVGVGGVSVTADRLQFFDFCQTYYTDSYRFIAPLNPRIMTTLGTFFHPLSKDVWRCLFISGLFGVVLLKVVATAETNLWNKQNSRPHMDNKFRVQSESSKNAHFRSFSNNCGFFLTVLCQKPYRINPTAFSVQCVYYGLSTGIFVIGMVFSSCLISFIFNFKPAPIADTQIEILRTRLPISLKDYDGHLNDYMEHASNTVLQKIYYKAQLVDYFESFHAIDEVIHGNMIYIDSTAKIYFAGRYRYLGAKGLKFHVGSETILEFANIGWPVQKNWPIKQKLNNIISRAVESGIVQHWMDRFMRGSFGGDDEAWNVEGYNLSAKHAQTSDIDPSIESKPEFTPLGKGHITGVLAIYLVGITLALFSFIGECFAKGCLNFLKLTKNTHAKFMNSKSVSTGSNKLNNVIMVKEKSPVGALDSEVFPTCLKKRKINGGGQAKLSSKTHHRQQYPPLVWDDFKDVNR